MTLEQLEINLMALHVGDRFDHIVEAWDLWGEIKSLKEAFAPISEDDFISAMLDVACRGQDQIRDQIRATTLETFKSAYQARQTNFQTKLTALCDRYNALVDSIGE